MSGGNFQPKPDLAEVTLVCVDCTPKRHLGHRAIEKSMAQCNFGAVKFLTHDEAFPHAVVIPPVNTIDEYSRFMVRELHHHVQTQFCLVVQADGYVLNGAGWLAEFLRYDYIGSPWEQYNQVGNGGFSLRSRRLLQACARHAPGENPHPEDDWICRRHRGALEAQGLRWPTVPLARLFGFEGRRYDGVEWSGISRPYGGAFGFHSWLSPLPELQDRPLVFHHSGDLGDVIYSLAVVRELGGGVYFLSPDCKHPHPLPPRNCRTDGAAFYQNVAPLLHRQSYIWNCHPTHATPPSADVDFNEFRQAYRRGGAENWKSLLTLHAQAFNLAVDGGEPWLECADPVTVPGRPIIVNATERYKNLKFPWWQLVNKYGHLMAFIGSDMEYELFRGFAPHIQIPRPPTANLWEAARVIQGGKVFVGNQSSLMAVALGLGQNVIQEVWLQNPNCKLPRKNAIYYDRTDGVEITIPEEWLA